MHDSGTKELIWEAEDSEDMWMIRGGLKMLEGLLGITDELKEHIAQIEETEEDARREHEPRYPYSR
jgi:hypothetical protein